MGAILSALAGGILQTVEITAASFVVGAVLGLLLATLRRMRSRIARLPAVAVVEVMRAVPPIVWLFIIFYGIGSGALKLSSFVAAVIGLGLISAAHLSEIYRAGLNAVPSGQWDAARAVALPGPAAYRHVVIPQALVIVVPPMATYAIGLLKDSAMASVIGAHEITFQAVEQTQQTANGLGNFAVAGLIYILLSVPIATLARWTDRQLTQRIAT